MWDLNSLTRDWTRVPCFAWLFLTTGPPSKCQVQSFELNYPTSQAPWGCIKEISSFGRRIIVIWPPWSCISTDLAVIMCIYQLDVPAPKHLLFFVGWLSGYIQIFEQFEWKIWQGKKMVTSNLGKHTVLLFSVEEFSLIWLLWPAEPYSTACISREIPCCFMPQGLYTCKSFCLQHSLFIFSAFSVLLQPWLVWNLPDPGGQSGLFWMSWSCASLYHCPYCTAL